jgi:phosphatidylglycerophosphate synthase
VADRRSKLRILPNAFTAVRPLLGAGCCIALVAGRPALATWLYLAAYLSDVADGLVARALHVSSSFGVRLDGWADLSTNIMITVAIVVEAIGEARWWIIVVMAAMVVAGATRGRWVAVHTVVGKAVGGAYRVAVFVVLLSFVPSGDRAVVAGVGTVVLLVTYLYEARVTLAERRSGDRALR